MRARPMLGVDLGWLMSTDTCCRSPAGEQFRSCVCGLHDELNSVDQRQFVLVFCTPGLMINLSVSSQSRLALT